LIPGVNKLGPLGSMPFSVGDGGVALDGVVVVIVVVVDVDGACSPLLPQPAVSAPIAISAPPPRTANKRRVNKFEFIVWSCSFKAGDPPPKGWFLGWTTHTRQASRRETSYVVMLEGNSQLYSSPLIGKGAVPSTLMSR